MLCWCRACQHLSKTKHAHQQLPARHIGGCQPGKGGTDTPLGRQPVHRLDPCMMASQMKQHLHLSRKQKEAC